MMECWNRDVDQRPSFREIHMFLRRKNMGYNPGEEAVAAARVVQRDVNLQDGCNAVSF